MEALRTQVDSLNWEVQRLDVENRKLRERDPAAEERVDREAELESAKADLVEMATRIKTLEQQLSEHTEAVAEAGRRAAAAELRAELTNRGDDDERAETSRQTAIAKLKDDLRTAN